MLLKLGLTSFGGPVARSGVTAELDSVQKT
jgi:hypothetical protein